MQEQSIEIVSHVLGALDELIVPHLSDPAAQAFADLCSRLLHQVIVRERSLGGLQARRSAATSAVRAELAQLLDSLPGTRRPADTPPLDPLVRAFAAHLEGLDSGLAKAICERIRRLVSCEREYLESLDPEVTHGIASMFSGGRVDRKEVKFGSALKTAGGELNSATLQSRLRQIGPESTNVAVKALVRLQGGFSKQTLRLELSSAPWGGTHFIIRRDRPNAYTGTAVADEFPVLRAMFGAGLSVPEPLWLETAADLGPPFMIVRQLAGANDIRSWQHDSGCATRFLQSLAQQMALLHLVPPAQSGLPAGRDQAVTELIRVDIERWSSLARLDEAAAPPLLLAERAWLLQNVPTGVRKPVVVHSDIGFHNMLTDHGTVTGLLDWEFCHLGDAQEDLNYVRPFVEMVGSWDEFLRLYAAAGGHEFHPEDARFWRVWGPFRSAAGCASALHAFREGNFGSSAEALTLAVSGLTFGPRYQLEVAELITGAAPRHSAPQS